MTDTLNQDKKEFYSGLRYHENDEETPYKAVICSVKPIRFETAAAAFKFFNMHDGRCLLSVVENNRQRIIAYKFK